MIVSGDKTGLLRNFRSVLVMRCPLHIKLTLLLAGHSRLGGRSLLGNLLFRGVLTNEGENAGMNGRCGRNACGGGDEPMSVELSNGTIWTLIRSPGGR